MKPLLLVDSHCHLDLLDLQPQEGGVESVIEHARSLGVGHMLCACINLASFPSMLGLAKAHHGVSISVGVHPNERPPKEAAVDDLVERAAIAEVVAIGETGLDYYRSRGDTAWQRDRFRSHIAAAKQAGLPLIVHCREAKDDTLRLLKEEGADRVGGVMHCFVEDWEAAERAMDLGFLISFSGIVTFKNAAALKEVAARVPLDRLLVETDSPYLAPVPYRGKPNRPGFVRYVAEHIAEIRGDSLGAIAHATTENFFRLFGRAAS